MNQRLMYAICVLLIAHEPISEDRPVCKRCGAIKHNGRWVRVDSVRHG